jgi:hypothetical protein
MNMDSAEKFKIALHALRKKNYMQGYSKVLSEPKGPALLIR